MIETYEDEGHPGHNVAYSCAVTQGRGHLAYAGWIGRGFSLYLEQVDASAPALSGSDVLLPSVLQTETGDPVKGDRPHGEVQVRTLRRCRAYEENGPFAPVSVLWVRVSFGGDADLASPWLH